MAEYIGNELELFSHARNWKNDYSGILKPFIRGEVLEAGAGIGETTTYLLNATVDSWLCLEPDPMLAGKINVKTVSGQLPARVTVTCGTSSQKEKSAVLAYFKVGYFLYKVAFRLLTGQRMGFGNFSCNPGKLLGRVATMENLWVDYSGGVLQQRIPHFTIELDRGKQYHGSSKMNSNSLVLHGLAAISVYFDSMSVRILKAAMGGMMLCVGGVAVILYYKVFTHEAIPGWASSLILLSIIIQLTPVTLIVLLMQLSSRKNVNPPGTDIYRKFIAEREKPSL